MSVHVGDIYRLSSRYCLLHKQPIWTRFIIKIVSKLETHSDKYFNCLVLENNNPRYTKGTFSESEKDIEKNYVLVSTLDDEEML